MRPLRSVLLLVLALASGTTLATGQGATPSAQQQAILDYHLTLSRANELIAAMDGMTKYVVSLPDFQERIAKSMRMTPAQQQAQLEQDPKAMAILKQHGLTAQEYLVGVPTLRMALMAAQGLAGKNITASPANVAFAKANLAQLKPKMEAAEGRK